MSGDYEALAQSILHLRNNPKIIQELAQKDRKYVEVHLSIELIGKIMKGKISKILSN